MPEMRIKEVARALSGRFDVDECLGTGAEKSVFLARECSTGRRVAIAAWPQGAEAENTVEDIDRIKALCVPDRHLVSIEEVIRSAEGLFIISPFFAGGDLEGRLASKPAGVLNLPETLQLAIEVCDALDHVHSSGVCHRDVKPSNILFDSDGKAFLGDFGLATWDGATSESSSAFVGTPNCAAPEQLTGGEASASSDLYALGCVLYESLTGRPPFVGSDASDVIRLHKVARPAAPNERDPGVPSVLSDLVLKLLEKDPQYRPHSASDVRSACAGIAASDIAIRSRIARRSALTDTDQPNTDLDAQDLVGRESEYASLVERLDQARSGLPTISIVCGDAGIGKTHLLREVADYAENHGWEILAGRGLPDAPLPFRLFVDALAPLSGRFSELDPADAEHMRQLLYTATESPQDVILTGREAHHHRLFGAALSSLRTFADRRPVLLIVDDFQWADSASQDLFDFLSRSLLASSDQKAPPISIIVSCRVVPENARINQILERTEEMTSSPRIELGELSPNHIAELIVNLGVESPPESLVRQIASVTQGNPLFVGEVSKRVRRKWTRGRRSGPGGASEKPWGKLPSSLAGAISERVAELPDIARSAVKTASVLGMRFDLAELAELSGLPLPALREVLEAAVHAGFIVIEANGGRFSHPMTREVIYESGDPEEREVLHLRVAKHFIARASGSSEISEVEIAHHLVRGGPNVAPIDLIVHSASAAEIALDRYAWFEAAELLEAALAVWDLSDGAQGFIVPRSRAELHRLAGLAYFRRYESESCLRHYEEAAQRFRKDSDAAGLARTLSDRSRAAVWLGLVAFGDPSDVGLLETALEELEVEDKALRSLIMSTLAESYWAARQTTVAESFGFRAFELAAEVGDHRLCAESSITLGLSMLQSFRAPEALEICLDGANHAQQAEDLFAEERCLQRAMLALFAMGQIGPARKMATQVEALVRTLDVPGEASITSSCLVGISTLRGQSEEAERFAEEAFAHIRRAKYPWTAVMTVPAFVHSLAMRGAVYEAGEAIAYLTKGELMFEDLTFFEPLAKDLERLVQAFSGEPIDNPATVGEVREEADGGNSYDLAQLLDVCVRVELADFEQHLPMAPHSRAILTDAVGKGTHFTSGWPFFVTRLLGVFNLLTGELDSAVLRLEEAIQLAADQHIDPEYARSQFDLARALALRNGQGDRERARELVSSTIPSIQIHFPHVLVERAEKLSTFLLTQDT